MGNNPFLEFDIQKYTAYGYHLHGKDDNEMKTRKLYDKSIQNKSTNKNWPNDFLSETRLFENSKYIIDGQRS